MRQSLAALLAVLLVALATFAPITAATASAASDAKVVIIVGATHSATAGYREDADSAYAEARKYTTNVVKVYSPNATWTKVKAAAVGASIVIYFGHGNGWPSPYTYDSKYTTKDGFGLNYDLNGDGKLSDNENKYYGEPSVATLDLAPNAIILLHHLCYASGNSEPGHAAPTLSVAKQRVDNYAAGFLKSKAQAVIADGHRGPESYLRSLFTTSQSIVDLWKNQPNFHDHVSSFASVRTSGATAYMDPDTTSGGYYRSLVTKPGLTSSEVVGAGAADDGLDITVPGKAEVADGGAGLFEDASLTPDGSTGVAATTLAAGERVKVLATGPVDADSGATPVQVEGLDDPDLQGWMRASDLEEGDSVKPGISGVSASSRVSPNGDTRSETATISADFSEPVDWQIRIKDAGGTVLHDASGHGSSVETEWDALDGDDAYPNGKYTWSISARDDWENSATTKTGTITLDLTAPKLSTVTPAPDEVRWISPNGDLAKESITYTAAASEAGSIYLRVANAEGTVIRDVTLSVTAAGTKSIVWNGKDDAGHVVPDGTYEVRMTPRDLAGNTGTRITRSVVVDTSLGDVDASKILFYPQDGDALAKTTTLRFTLTRSAVVTWQLVDEAGTVVRTFLDGASKPAGSYTKVFDGKRLDGTYLPGGTYRSVVTLAGDGEPVISQYRSITMKAFAITVSDTTPARGQSITVNATSAESVSTTPRVYVYQPGKTTWSVGMSKVSTGKYKATLTIKTGGGAGEVRFLVKAKDIDGHSHSSNLYLPLH